MRNEIPLPGRGCLQRRAWPILHALSRSLQTMSASPHLPQGPEGQTCKAPERESRLHPGDYQLLHLCYGRQLRSFSSMRLDMLDSPKISGKLSLQVSRWIRSWIKEGMNFRKWIVKLEKLQAGMQACSAGLALVTQGFFVQRCKGIV